MLVSDASGEVRGGAMEALSRLMARHGQAIIIKHLEELGTSTAGVLIDAGGSMDSGGSVDSRGVDSHAWYMPFCPPLPFLSAPNNRPR